MKKIGEDFAVSFYNIQTFYSRMEDTLYSSRMIYEVIRNSGIGVGIGIPRASLPINIVPMTSFDYVFHW